MKNCPLTVHVKIAAREGKQDAIFKCARVFSRLTIPEESEGLFVV